MSKDETTVQEWRPRKPLYRSLNTKIGPTGGKNTSQCFVGELWDYRNCGFDILLDTYQCPTDATNIATLKDGSRSTTLINVVADVLGVNTSIGHVIMGNLLIKRGHTVTLPQIEVMVLKARSQSWERKCMSDLGYLNFFFIETGDRKNPVLICYVNSGRCWSASFYRLSDNYHWIPGYNLLVRVDKLWIIRNIGGR